MPFTGQNRIPSRSARRSRFGGTPVLRSPTSATRARSFTALASLLLLVSWLGLDRDVLAADASTDLPAKGQTMWMRGGVLLAVPEGRAGWLVPDPIQVEVGDDHRVRLVDGKGRTRVGWCPGFHDLRRMGIRNLFPALGLFAQTDGPLKVQPDGPTVGHVAKGAFVPVRNLGKVWTEVNLPFVSRLTAVNDTNPFKESEPFLVSTTLLGLERQPTSPDVARAWGPKRGAPTTI